MPGVPTEFGALRFTLAQVLEIERPAWNVDPEFFYNGIDILRHSAGVSVVIGENEAPQEEWRHRSGCRCRACRSGSIDDR